MINKIFQKIGAITCNISLLLNSFLPYFAAIPAYAVDTAPIAYSSSSHKLYFSLDTANYTAYQFFYKTDTKIDSVSGSKLPEYLFLGTCSDASCLSQNFESAILKIKTNSSFYYYYFTLKNSQLQIMGEGNSSQLDLTDEELNLLEGTIVAPTAVPTLVPTLVSTPSPVEVVCLTGEAAITTSMDSDWIRDDVNNISETKAKVQLGVRYVFPQENKVSVTFKCLPKDENLRTTLKIQQVKTSDLKLPNNTNVGEYAYDITTGMTDGNFKYDVTLPKSSDQVAEVSFIEKTLEQAKTSVTSNDIKPLSNLEQQTETVKATNIDHFTIFIVKTYKEFNGNLIEEENFYKGDTVHVTATGVDLTSTRVRIKNSDGQIKKECDETLMWQSKCEYLIPNNAKLGTWSVDLGHRILAWWYWENNVDTFTVNAQVCGDGIISGSETCDGTNLGNYPVSDFQCNRCSIELIEPKIDICHSTSSHSNPYISSSPNKSGDLNGHASDTGPIWYPGIAVRWGDIIPPFAYVGGTFPGLNWSTEGQSIYRNNCKVETSLKIVKIVDNTGGGSKTATDFEFSLNNGPYTNFGVGGSSEVSLNIGDTYSVTENPNVDYSVNYNNCSGALSSSSTICTVTNTYIPQCGDSTVYGEEECDDGNRVNTDACTNSCKLPVCGDGFIQFGEECDGVEGTIGGQNFCSPKTCKLIPIYDGNHTCSDGKVPFKLTDTPLLISSTNSTPLEYSFTGGKEYLLKVMGTYTYDKNNFGRVADSAYATKNNWSSLRSDVGIWGTNRGVTSVLGDLGFGMGVIEWDDNNLVDSDHVYEKIFNPSSDINAKFVISDWYGDWYSQYQNQSAMVDNSGSLQLEVYECQNPPVKIYAQKVLCDNESYLPNNTQGAITADTAQNWVNNSNSHCRIVDGWDFQFGGIGSYGAFQSNTASLPGWQTMTTVSGVATASINDLSSYGSKIEVREVFPDNSYIPFSNSSSNISAEIYCTGDSANYDNWEWINNPQPGQSYYCVAFNAPNFGSINVTKYNDLNGDGLQGDGEANLSGWTINLSGQTSVVTDINGLATFNKISFGDYTLSETIQPGWTQTNIVCDGDEGIDNDNSHQVSVTAGQTINCKIGNRQLSNVTVYKFNDLNGNGTKDEGENNLSGWTINLTGQTSVSTNEAGQAIFNNLLPGTYDLSENLDSQPGWIQTNIYCDDNNGPGVKITKEGEAYGHHGQCAGWNECKDAATCALWACHVRGYSNLVSYGEGKACTDSSIKNCHLFQYGVNSEPPVLPIASNYEDNGYIDYDWGKGCGVSGVTDIVCSNGSDSGDSSDRGYVSGSQVIVTSGQNKTCYIGNRRLSPEARISKKNNAGLSGLAPGSSVEYKIKLIISGNDVSDFNVTDLLSNGIKYRPGSFSVLKNGASYSIPEPQYHSPGVWKLGDLNAGDVVELSYTADISSDQQPGTYADLVLAYGKAKYEAKSVRAIGEDSDYVNDNFVGTNVIVAKSTQNSVSAGVEKEEVREEGQVLGASTELPSTGSSTLWLIISLLMSLFGLTLIKKSKKLLIVLLFISFCVFPSNAAASSNLSLRVEQPKTPTNLNDVNLNFVALDILARPVTIKCYKKYSSDTTFTQFSTETLIAGGNASHCSLASVLSAEGNYQLKVVAEAEADSVESILSLDYKTSGPGTPGDYRKEHPNNCDYKIHFKTADDSGKTVKVEIYRSDITSFNLDSGSFITAVNLGSNQEHDLTNSVPDCSKNYYYVLRAFDNAGNGSGTTGDSVVKVVSTTSSITTTSTTSSSTSQGAIPVTNVTIAPEAPETITAIPTLGSEEGSVLGTQNQTPSFLQKYWLPLALALIAGIAIIRYVFVKRKASR